MDLPEVVSPEVYGGVERRAGKDLCKGGKGKDTASKCEVEKSI
jgi:hypothetical protein